MSSKERIVWLLTFAFALGVAYFTYSESYKLEKERDVKQYSQGFIDGIQCLELTNLEMVIKNEPKTFGELKNICIERNKIKER